jgi:hypothetical protein
MVIGAAGGFLNGIQGILLVAEIGIGYFVHLGLMKAEQEVKGLMVTLLCKLKNNSLLQFRHLDLT